MTLAGLESIVGAEHVLADPDLRATYERDWTGRFTGSCRAVVRPADTHELAAVVQWCARHEVAVVPQGGHTGLVAGAVPPAGALVLSTTRLRRLDPVDEVAGQVTVGAGVTLADLQRHVAPSGWAFGVDLGARESCTVGGMVATNAGGLNVLRYGAMRAQVLGLEAVLADGRVVRHLGGLVKDNSGYDLSGLLTGSEGTLGIVTAARLRLVPAFPDRLVALVAVGDLAEALRLGAELRRSVDGLHALEGVLGAALDLVCDVLDLPHPFGGRTPAVTLLVEWAGRGDAPPALVDRLAALDAVAADDPTGRARLWRYREGVTEAIARLGTPHKLDVTLPLGGLAAFAAAVTPVVHEAFPGSRVVLFGHLGDGNLHVNVLGPDPDDDTVDDAVLRLVVASGGSISAEHGIGRAKVRWLALQRTPEELAAMRAVKAALDPHGLLNPGALLPPA